MLDSGELESLLERGLRLKEEISCFVKNPTAPEPLMECITKLIGDIQIPGPSSNENDETRSKAICLGSIKKNLTDILTDIKPTTQSTVPPSSYAFFRPKIQPGNSATLKANAMLKLSNKLNQLANLLNQLENLLNKNLYLRTSFALGG